MARLPLGITPTQALVGGGIAAAGVALAACFASPGDAPTDVGSAGASGAGDLRNSAMRLLNAYLPCTTGSAEFSEIAKGYLGPPGTTCGFLTAWLLWRLGCVDPSIVNRDEPQAGLTYTNSMNIARLVNGGKALGAWRTQEGGARPLPGDLCYYAVDPPDIRDDGSKNYKEHVNVCVDCSGDMWRSGDAGRTSPAGTQMAEFVSRKRLSSGKIDYYGGPRQLIGWVDLTAVPLNGTPMLV